ncbi:transposase [Streptomyces sp. M1013]|uniref:transposase n=1 Tax=Streptomyces sp. M1013 TaxID=549798 RepID=UPI00345BA00F
MAEWTRPCRRCEASGTGPGSAPTWCWATAATTTTTTSTAARCGTDLDVKPLIARRWGVERAFAHVHRFRRLRNRWEIRDDIHEAFLAPGYALICRLRLRSRC